MARPTDSVTKFFRVRDGAGAVVTGLTVADFSFIAYHQPYGGAVAAFAHASVVTHQAAGIYAWTYSLPPSAGFWSLDATPIVAAQFIEWMLIDGETENQDLDSIYANATNRQGILTGTAVIGNRIGIELVVYRLNRVTIAVTDSAGEGVNLTVYSRYRVALRSIDQVAVKWTAGHHEPYGVDIAVTDAGSLNVSFPESLMGPICATWSAARPIIKGDFIVPTVNNGWIYQASADGTTGGSEPTWPTTEAATVVDNGITWTARKRLIWTATTAKIVGQVIRPTVDATIATPRLFRCTQLGTTAGTEPDWTTATEPGSTVTDGTVVWERQADPYAALAIGTAENEQRWEVIADDDANSFQTVPIIASSTCDMTRREEGT